MTPSILGILNITEDSFSDGGRYLAPAAAIARGEALAKDGADILDIGAASSNPNAKPVPAETEIARLAAVLPAFKRAGIAVSLDTFSPAVQRWALDQGVGYLNDILGFPDPSLYDALAASPTRLILMHAVQTRGRADPVRVDPGAIVERVCTFFEARLKALAAAGIARQRVILDPGMGFFLGSDPAASYAVLRALPLLKELFGLPLLISVSRKAFLRRQTGRGVQEAGAATLAAELFAAAKGADYIRTHDPGALKDGLKVQAALAGASGENRHESC